MSAPAMTEGAACQASEGARRVARLAVDSDWAVRDRVVASPGRSRHWAQIEAAKRLCATCPATEQCERLAAHMAALGPGEPELAGVWHGTDSLDRRRLARGRR